MFALTFWIIIGIMILVTICRNYCLCIIRGNSMFPYFANGDLVLVKKRDFNLFSGGVYIFKLPDEDKIFVKRLEHFRYEPEKGNSIYFLGDNKEDSYDSRSFGYVSPSTVLGEVIKILWHN